MKTQQTTCLLTWLIEHVIAGFVLCNRWLCSAECIIGFLETAGILYAYIFISKAEAEKTWPLKGLKLHLFHLILECNCKYSLVFTVINYLNRLNWHLKPQYLSPKELLSKGANRRSQVWTIWFGSCGERTARSSSRLYRMCLTLSCSSRWNWTLRRARMRYVAG